jgi:hypothetical protein
MKDRYSGLVVRVPVYITEMYCVSCEVRTEFIYLMWKKVDRLCGLVVRVPGCRKEMYCDSCEVRTTRDLDARTSDIISKSKPH